MDEHGTQSGDPMRKGEASTGSQTWTPAGSKHAAATDRADEGRTAHDVRYEGAGVMAGLLVLLAVAILVVVVVAQNTDRVTFELLWWDARVPLAVLVLCAALATLVVDQVVGLVWRRRRRKLRALSHPQH